MRTIIGNWKMQLTISQAAKLANDMANTINKYDSVRVIVCPSYAALGAVKDALAGSSILLGAQDVCDEEKGTYTGEVSAQELVDYDVRAVIIGHSERRSHLGETDSLVNSKLKRTLHHKLLPIVCVGETRDERDAGKRDVVIEQQVREAIKGVQLSEKDELIIAYEPIWVIGSGQAVEPEDAVRSHVIIREVLRDVLDSGIADKHCHVIYGGSVDRKNILGFFAQNEVEGVLVGGASLDAAEFAAIVDAGEKA